MFKNNRILKRIAILCIAVLVVIIAWGGLVPDIASSQQVESRISSLEVDIRGIESRLNRIESQLNQVGRSGSPRAATAPPASPPNLRGNRPQLNREQMFDRLATLAIELKERIDKLDARVSKLESRGAPRKNN